MKHSLLKLIAPVAFSVTCLAGCIPPIPGGTTTDAETNARVSAYYKDFDFDEEGTTLIKNLSQLMWDTHTVFVKYSQVNTYLVENSAHGSTDRDPTYTPSSSSSKSYNQMFYTGKIGSSGTREHVWPCANSSNLWVHQKGNGGKYDVDVNTYVGGGSDLYHVRPADGTVNTKRGNSKFVDFDDDGLVSTFDESLIETYTASGTGIKTKFYGLGNDGYAKYCEPADEFKGDVARIFMYLYVHYAQIGGVTIKSQYQYMTGNLKFTDVLGYTSLNKCYEVLCDWNELDPPSPVEKNRNNVVEKVQGNRNPFIDYPELISACWGL